MAKETDSSPKSRPTADVGLHMIVLDYKPTTRPLSLIYLDFQNFSVDIRISRIHTRKVEHPVNLQHIFKIRQKYG